MEVTNLNLRSHQPKVETSPTKSWEVKRWVVEKCTRPYVCQKPEWYGTIQPEKLPQHLVLLSCCALELLHRLVEGSGAKGGPHSLTVMLHTWMGVVLKGFAEPWALSGQHRLPSVFLLSVISSFITHLQTINGSAHPLGCLPAVVAGCLLAY